MSPKRWGGRICLKVLNHWVLNAPLEKERIMSAMHCTSTSQTGTHVNACYATLHTCKCTSRESEIVLRRCWLKFAGKWCLYATFLLYKTPACLKSSQSPIRLHSGCCVNNSDGEYFIFHMSVLIQQSTLFPSSVLFLFRGASVPSSPPLRFLLRKIM